MRPLCLKAPLTHRYLMYDPLTLDIDIRHIYTQTHNGLYYMILSPLCLSISVCLFLEGQSNIVRQLLLGESNR